MPINLHTSDVTCAVNSVPWSLGIVPHPPNVVNRLYKAEDTVIASFDEMDTENKSLLNMQVAVNM